MENNIYKGYRILRGTTEEINNVMTSQDTMLQMYTNEYLIIENEDDGSQKEMRFDGEKLVPLKLPPSKVIKGKNALQRCALDALNNNDISIVCILGKAGSGKSYLSARMALYQVEDRGNQSKVVAVREPVGGGRETGYLKGDFGDKTKLFFQPLTQQLNGGEFEVQSLQVRGMLESITPYYIKGCTYPESILLVEEAEDLTKKQIKLIGTRVGNNSRIILSGDYKQSEIDASTDNALVQMCRSLKGNPLFACIMLDEDVRSETSKLFAGLFE
jgi:PhoH-like ATPase